MSASRHENIGLRVAIHRVESSARRGLTFRSWKSASCFRRKRFSATRALRECAARKASRTRSNTTKDSARKQCATARKMNELDMNAQDRTLQNVKSCDSGSGRSFCGRQGDFKRWPITYDEVATYYERAERFMGVYGNRDGLWNLPDGVFQKTVPMRCPEMLLKRGVERLKAKGRVMEFVTQRKAIPTDSTWRRRPTCHYCGQCMNGCDIDSKYTSANTPIPL